MADRVFDVVVVGCGVAGLSAAVAASEAGAKVAVLERATYDERGGGTRYTTAAIRMQSEDAISDDFSQRFLDNCGYHVQLTLRHRRCSTTTAAVFESAKKIEDWSKSR